MLGRGQCVWKRSFNMLQIQLIVKRKAHGPHLGDNNHRDSYHSLDRMAFHRRIRSARYGRPLLIFHFCCYILISKPFCCVHSWKLRQMKANYRLFYSPFASTPPLPHPTGTLFVYTWPFKKVMRMKTTGVVNTDRWLIYCRVYLFNCRYCDHNLLRLDKNKVVLVCAETSYSGQ